MTSRWTTCKRVLRKFPLSRYTTITVGPRENDVRPPS